MNTRQSVLRAALFAAGAAAALAAVSPAQAASHYDCQVHGFRPYSHRHIDPNDTLVSCDRPQQLKRYPTAARCVAHARRQGGSGAVAPGTQVASQVPYPPYAPARDRAHAMNIACSEAIESCYHASQGLGTVQCSVIDRKFVD